MKTLARWLWRSCWLLGIAALVVSITGAGSALYPKIVDGKSSNPPDAAVAAADQGSVCVVLGTVDVKHGLRSLYPVQAGRVEDVRVEEDQKVKSGELLLSLDKVPARNHIKQAKAEVDAARARCAKAKTGVEQQKLGEDQQGQAIRAAEAKLRSAEAFQKRAQANHNLVGNKEGLDLETAKGMVEEAQANLRAQQIMLQKIRLNDPMEEVRLAEAALAGSLAQLEQAEKQLKECDLVAPSDGTIVRLYVGKGDVLGPQPRQPAILFCPSDPRIIRAELDQEAAARVRKGLKVLIEDDVRTGSHWEGKVDHIPEFYLQRRSNVAEPFSFNESRILECLINITPPPDGKELPRLGQRVRVRILDQMAP